MPYDKRVAFLYYKNGTRSNFCSLGRIRDEYTSPEVQAAQDKDECYHYSCNIFQEAFLVVQNLLHFLGTQGLAQDSQYTCWSHFYDGTKRWRSQ